MNGVILSVISPAHNEHENVVALVEEVGAAGALVAEVLGGGDEVGFEFIVVDDCSTDETRGLLLEMMNDRPWLRVVAMTPDPPNPPGKGNGQSAAFHAGFRAARGEFVALLDADLQNDPADIVEMARLIVRESADMVQGDRSADRRDNVVRRIGSIVGRLARRVLVGDTIRDTGCSLRLMRREIGVRLPMEFRGAHRFIPAVANQMGYRVVEMQVNHRPRVAGTTKYGFGITQRALPGLFDCFAVRWMGNRRRPVGSAEVTREGGLEIVVREGAQDEAGTKA